MDVSEYLASLTHARKAEVERLRSAILDSDPELTETIKWNAPNYAFAGEDRVTFRLQPGDHVELVLHRGVRKRHDIDSFAFDDPSRLIRWATQDRGVVVIANGSDLDALLPQLLPVIHAWVRA